MHPILQASQKTFFVFLLVFSFLTPPQYLHAQCPISAPTFGNNDAVCRNETTLRNGGLRVNCTACSAGSTVKITWWTAATGGVKVGTGSPFNPLSAGVVSNTVVGVTRFFAQCECDGCVSPTRTATEFRVFDRPEPVISGAKLVCPSSLQTYSTPSVAGNAYQWTVSPAGFGTIVGSSTGNSIQIQWTNAQSAGAYTVKVVQTNANGCSNTAEIPVFTRTVFFFCQGDLKMNPDVNCRATVAIKNLTNVVAGTDDMKIQLLSATDEILEEGFGKMVIDGIGLTGQSYSHIGPRLRYRITEPCNNFQCEGILTIEDKAPPVLTAPTDATLSCAQLPTDAAPNTTLSGKPTVQDCNETRMTHTDEVRTANCNTPFTALPSDLAAIKTVPFPTSGDIVKVILRRFVVLDIFENESICYQYIFVRRAVLSQVICPPRSLELACQDYIGADVPTSLSGFPLLDGDGNMATTADHVAFTNASCSLTAAYTDQINNICTNSRRIVRTWTITDVCNWQSITCTQIISIVDKTPPPVKADFSQFYTQNNALLRRDTSVSFDGFTIIDGGGSATGGVQDVYVRSNSFTCGGSARFTITASDVNCSRALLRIEANDTRFSLVAGFPQYNAATGETVAVFDGAFPNFGDYTFSFSVTDACGNRSNKNFRVLVRDNSQPQAVCQNNIRLTLSTLGAAVLSSTAVNNASSDNCTLAKIEIRRLTNCQNPSDTAFSNQIGFSCCDVGTPQSVMLRTWDAAGNYADCITTVDVLETIRPTCTPPPSRSIRCDTYNPSVALSTFGQPTFFDNCGLKDTVYTEKRELTNCKQGTLTRKWVISDKSGLKDSCEQMIRVNSLSDFTVDFPDDIQTTCADTLPTKDQLRERILNNVQNKDGHILNAGCGSMTVGIVDDTIQNSLGYCYAIYRRITVFDACKYTPNNAPANGETGMPVCGDVHSQSNWSTQNSQAWTFLTRPAACSSTRERRFRDADELAATNPAFADGIITFTQVILVNDTVKPVFTACPTPTVFTNLGTTASCNAQVSLTTKAEDQCLGTLFPNALLKYSWQIVDSATNQTVRQGEGSSLSLALDFGTYFVKWSAIDRCNNVGNCEQKIYVRDTKAPTIVCRDKTVDLNGNGTDIKAILNVQDILANAQDNCSPNQYLSRMFRLERALTADSTAKYPPSVNDTLVFNCSDALRQMMVRLWTCDESGNAQFCRATITVRDSLNLCQLQTNSVVSGIVRTETGISVENVTVSAAKNGVNLGDKITPVGGNFLFSGLQLGNNLTLRASREDDPTNGVRTSDIALVSRYILGEPTLNSPYKIIAADVNRDGDVSSLDMLQMRRAILFISNGFPNSPSWRFVDGRYAFRDPLNPLAEDFPEAMALTNIPLSSSTHFIGVKVGDVNNSVRANANQVVTRGANSALTFEVEDRNLTAGKDYEIMFSVKDFKSTAYQFTLNHTEGVEILDIQAADLPNLGTENFARFKSAITTSWNGFLRGDVNVFVVKLRAKKNQRLSQILSIGSNLTAAEASDEQGATSNVLLKFKGSLTEGSDFTLYQNAPNPFAQQTRIAFQLPESAPVKLSFFDAAGRLLTTVSGDFGKGYNEFSVQKSQLNTASGIVWYRLETPTHTATRKMIIEN